MKNRFSASTGINTDTDMRVRRAYTRILVRA